MPQPPFPDDAFPPPRNAPCFCGSNERFKRCCGNRSPDRAPPFGVRIVENFLPPEDRRELLALAKVTPGRRFTTPDGRGGRVYDDQRVTEWVDFRESHQQILDDVVGRAFAEQIVPAEGQAIAWYEEPQLLRYTTGGYYMHHSDAWQLVPEAKAWHKVVDRDISMLLYLDEDFEGGELEFRRLFYTLRPRAGMLVWFPSDVRYEHMAKPVTAGHRSVVVSWAALAGVERVQAQRADRVLLWPGREKLIRGDA